MPSPNALLDVSPYPADGYAKLADRLKALLHTSNDVVFVQAEAILALEAAATSLARPGLVALNIVTSPYGGYFGDWLRRAGATVHTVAGKDGHAITPDAVEAALDALPQVDLVAMVHAETSSGIVNPLADIAALVHSTGALLVVDAVASFGGHPLDVHALGIDICVVGPQKALGGPAGLSALSISPRAWAAMQTQPAPSSLSLLDLKTNWLDRGRGVVPGMPSALEFWALEAALDRLDEDGLDACIERHAHAAAATRAGLRALGAELWIERDAEASALATTLVVPPGIGRDALIATARSLGASLSPAFGSIAERVVRLDHAGPRATLPAVTANLAGIAAALKAAGQRPDLARALDAAANDFGPQRS